MEQQLTFIKYIKTENYGKFVENYEIFKDMKICHVYGDMENIVNILMLCCISNSDTKMIEYIMENDPKQFDYCVRQKVNKGITHNWLTYLMKFNTSITVYKYIYTNYQNYIHKTINFRMPFYKLCLMQHNSSMLIHDFILPISNHETDIISQSSEYVHVFNPFNEMFTNNMNIEVFKYVIEETNFLGIDIKKLYKNKERAFLFLACVNNKNINVIEYLLSLKISNVSIFELLTNNLKSFLGHIILNGKIAIIKRLFSNYYFEKYNLVDCLKKSSMNLVKFCFRRTKHIIEVFDILIGNKYISISKENNIITPKTLCSFILSRKDSIINAHKFDIKFINECFKIMAKKRGRELLDILTVEEDIDIREHIKSGYFNTRKEMICYRKKIRNRK